MEILNHAEFLGVMRANEALSRWFVNDTSTASQVWRIKGHAAESFWSWVASWARCASMPSDLGGDDTGYVLPKLHVHEHVVAADRSLAAGDMLFRIPDMSATSIHKEKRLTMTSRVDAIASAINAEPDEPWIVWCETDDESAAIAARIDGAQEVRGSMPQPKKESRLVAFSRGDLRVIVTKARIAGFGLNWQHCARQAFVGLSFSYEAYYQAVRRSWRFGQIRPVHVHVAMADTERDIWSTIRRKAGDHREMQRQMRNAMTRAQMAAERMTAYQPKKSITLPEWIS